MKIVVRMDGEGKFIHPSTALRYGRDDDLAMKLCRDDGRHLAETIIYKLIYGRWDTNH